jgi:hypothetical protein
MGLGSLEWVSTTTQTRNADMNDLNKAQVLADSAHLLAEKINRARFEGKKISDEQTVKLCEVLSVLTELLGEAA